MKGIFAISAVLLVVAVCFLAICFMLTSAGGFLLAAVLVAIASGVAWTAGARIAP